MADVEKYLDLITAFHRGKPKFSAMVEAVSQCFVGAQDSYGQMVPAYDLDDAVGVQLDAVGEWVGISRNVRTPLEGVYFSFDIAGLGFEQGVWQGPFDPDTGVTSLDDETYRVLIRAKIGANHWDGTLESSAAILNSIFSAGTSPIQVNASAEPFGTGDGAATQFQLKYQGRPVFQVGSATIFKNDWQGNQRLYATPRTNLFRFSEDFSNAAWGNATAIRTKGYPAPDGSNNGTLITVQNANSCAIFQSISLPMPQSTFSVYVAPGNSSTLTMRYVSFDTSVIVTFNLATGQVSNPLIGKIEASQGGWYRCSIAPAMTGADLEGQLYAYLATNAGTQFSADIGNAMLVFGAQVEIGLAPTPYIPTGNAAVTVTDYSASSTGLITMGQVPASGAALTWTGDGQIYPSGTYVFIQDNGDMSIDIGIAGDRPSAVFLALLTGGYIPIKPEGVRVNYFIVPNVDGPLFGFDVNNQYISGFDVGAWGDLYPS